MTIQKGGENQWQKRKAEPKERAVKAKAGKAVAVAAFNDPNVVFIPLLTDVRARVTSANGKHFLVGSAPYADTHPIPPYYVYYGGLIAEKISKAVLSVAG